MVKDNYFVGAATVRRWGKLTLRANALIAPGTVLSLELPKEGGVSNYAGDENAYFQIIKGGSPFSITENKQGKTLDFAQWQKASGLDGSAKFQQARPTGARVFVRPNQYEPGRANVIVYNWDLDKTVDVDLKGVLKAGDRYKVISAQDFFGPAVAEGTYDGKPVKLPMKEYRAPAPIGKEDYTPPATGPEFNVFVVLPAK
jgi:hypothetical protein